MISSNDVVQARDDAALKAMKISARWGIMFSGNGELFSPFVSQVRREMGKLDTEHNLEAVNDLLERLYKTTREKRFVDLHIARLGYKTIEEFRVNGRKELGEVIFGNIIDDLRRFDLGIDFIVYGYDNKPHICSLENPGIVINHDLEKYVAVGAGTYMAQAALSRKSLSPDLNSVIYRTLGAKFSAETASGVGTRTGAQDRPAGASLRTRSHLL